MDPPAGAHVGHRDAVHVDRLHPPGTRERPHLAGPRDQRDGPAIFGANSPQWRLFAHASVSALMAAPGLDLPLYLVVWVADDESDGDGDPAVDRNERILVWAVAFGAGGARRSVEARVGRTPGGDLQLLSWIGPR